jgi:hypothetical protein
MPPAMMKILLPVLCLALSSCMLPSTGGSGDAGAPPVTQGNTSTQSPGAQAAAATDPAAASGSVKSVTIDTTKKLEYVNLWVDLGDPAGQRALVPYLLKPDEWMLVKCEMLSPTSKHYTFQRVTSADGRSLPQVDLFKQGR